MNRKRITLTLIIITAIVLAHILCAALPNDTDWVRPYVTAAIHRTACITPTAWSVMQSYPPPVVVTEPAYPAPGYPPPYLTPTPYPPPTPPPDD